MTYYPRRLPHWHPGGASIFVTWRPFGTLPRQREGADSNVGQADSLPTACRRFVVQDRQLDAASSGPRWLGEPKIAGCVAETLLLDERVWKKYDLWACSYHVHVLLKPHVSLKQVTRAIRS